MQEEDTAAELEVEQEAQPSENERELSPSEDIELDIRESIEEIKQTKADNGAESDSPEKQEAGPRELEKPDAPQAAPSKGAEKIDPPATWTVEGKEWFNRQPPEIKREFAKRAGDMERQFHKISGEIAEKRKHYGEVDEIIAPVKEQWAMRGLTPASAIRSFVAAQQLLDRDPVAGLMTMARSYGLTFSQLAEAEAGGQRGYQPQQNAENPHLLQLETRLNQLEAEKQAAFEAQRQQTTQRILSELHTVRDETDAYGRYVRPELHDADFQQRMVPVVRGLAQSSPQANPRDLVLQAYVALSGNATPRVQPPPKQQPDRRAALSVRSSTATPKPHNPEVPESAEDTVRLVMKELGMI